MARKQPKPSFDLVKGAAIGRWREIATTVFGIDGDYLTGAPGPCPKCRDGKDRWRVFEDFDAIGGAICNQCGRNLGDGFKLGDWFCGWDKNETLARVADYLNVTAHSSSSKSRNGKDADPAEHLVFKPWVDSLAAIWCLSKPPIITAALKRCHARMAVYRGREDVIAIPVWGEQLHDADPVGWCLYAIGGGTLPKYTKLSNGKFECEQVKVKLTYGSQPGLMGPVEELQQAKTSQTSHVWKLEGVSDLLAWWSLPEVVAMDPLAAGHIAVTNASGAGEKPLQWIVRLFAGKQVYTLHDADEPGERGAIGWEDDQENWRPGWASEAARYATESRQISLPHEIAKDHGKDLRDYLTDDEPSTFRDLLELAAVAPIIPPPDGDPPADATDAADAAGTDPDDMKPNEAIDDPHRLAVINLNRYDALTDGGKIRYWREEWYVYKANRYRRIGPKEFSAKIAGSIKEEFNRANIAAQVAWEEKREAARVSGEEFKEERPVAKKVTKTLVTNVIQATSGMQILSAEIELNSVIDGTGRRSGSQKRNWIAMQNGIVDVDSLLADEDDDEDKVLLPHSSDWFSTVCLPYEFNVDAKCPQWEAFLRRCMNVSPDWNASLAPKKLSEDPEIRRNQNGQASIDILQEWAGYLLLADTSQQKFLVNEGEGGNGKSVYIAGIQALLGEDNCCAVPLDKFGGQFDLTETLGKLANICGDMGEIDKVSEGHLKSFVSGDRMLFSRKNLSGINCAPSARLMFNTNNRPRFADKSSGIWRRLLLIEWEVTITNTERVLGMDQVAWWKASGELPGIFLWAVKGLDRLRAQKAFTHSDKMEEAIAGYRCEVNPAREFLTDHCEHHPTTAIRSKTLYDLYRKWADMNGNHPMNNRVFGKEVLRAFPKAKKGRLASDDRHWRYEGIRFSQETVCGEKPDQYPLFGDDF